MQRAEVEVRTHCVPGLFSRRGEAQRVVGRIRPRAGVASEWHRHEA
jgi:hypothetical protein